MLGKVFSKEAAKITVCNFDTELKGSLFELKGSGEDGRLTEKEYELVRPMLMYVVNDISELIKRYDLELPKAFFRNEEDLKRFLRLSQDQNTKETAKQSLREFIYKQFLSLSEAFKEMDKAH